MVNTTGATLSLVQYRYFYTHFPPCVRLSNSAGGTDTATSLIAADPAAPLRVGEMHIQALGMDVDVVDPETGPSMHDTGQPGEMIIRKPIPSMPACFWGRPRHETLPHILLRTFLQHRRLGSTRLDVLQPRD